jgi:hypothetical protein
MTNNIWNQFTNCSAEVQNFNQAMPAEASQLISQINSLYSGGTAPSAAQLANLQAQLASFLQTEANQDTIIANSASFQTAEANLTKALNGALSSGSTSNVVNNPAYPVGSSIPTLPITNNPDGTATVEFTCAYNHANDGGCYLDASDCTAGTPWLPSYEMGVNGGNSTFGMVLNAADVNKGSVQTATYCEETISVVCNGNGTMTVTVTGSPSDFQSTATAPNTSALSNFMSNMYA